MKLRLLAIALLFAFAGAVSFAHGNKVHVRGTVQTIGPDLLQVKTPEGKTVEVKLAASTIYVSHTNKTLDDEKVGVRIKKAQDQPAKLGDLAVGDLVVIHATPKGSALEADEVRFSQPPKPKS